MAIDEKALSHIVNLNLVNLETNGTPLDTRTLVEAYEEAKQTNQETKQPDEMPSFTHIAVARALCKWRNGKRSSVSVSDLPMVEQHAYFEQAEDAIAAYLERHPKRESIEEKLSDATEALHKINEWSNKAYSEEIFTDLSDGEMKMIQAGLSKAVCGVSNAMDRLHASWGRHLLDGIGKMSAAALSKIEVQEGK